MRDRKLWIGLGIGCAVLVVGCVVVAAVALIGGGVLLQRASDAPGDISVRVDAPAEVARGDSMAIVVEVTNTGGDSQILDSIDIMQTYLSGFTVHGAEPPFTESFAFAFGSEWQSYTFQHEIPPGATLTVQLLATAVQQGDFSGSVDVCINTASACTTFMVRTVVGE